MLKILTKKIKWLSDPFEKIERKLEKAQKDVEAEGPISDFDDLGLPWYFFIFSLSMDAIYRIKRGHQNKLTYPQIFRKLLFFYLKFFLIFFLIFLVIILIIFVFVGLAILGYNIIN